MEVLVAQVRKLEAGMLSVPLRGAGGRGGAEADATAAASAASEDADRSAMATAVVARGDLPHGDAELFADITREREVGGRAAVPCGRDGSSVCWGWVALSDEICPLDEGVT